MEPHNLIKDIESFLLEEIDVLFKKSLVEENHTLEHSKTVLNHLNNCLKYEQLIPEDYNHPNDLIKIISLKCAAILHDADDKKFFPNNSSYENARGILQKLREVHLLSNSQYLIDIDLVIKIISLVSFSENGTNENLSLSDRWMLLVRYCDRLESIGNPGILRAYTYSLFINRPLYTENTPTPQTFEEIKNISRERYSLYLENGISESMIDHFFDKILFVCDDLVKNSNPYIMREASIRSNISYNFVLDFCIKKSIDIEKLLTLRIHSI